MTDRPDTLVAGATGFIGRWLTAELLTAGRSVAVTVRDPASRGAELRAWLRGHGADDRALAGRRRRAEPSARDGRAAPLGRPARRGALRPRPAAAGRRVPPGRGSAGLPRR
ncbi:NAD-dependent epimerase/dehydratase family protein [Nonomuraea sp. NPDC002799]